MHNLNEEVLVKVTESGEQAWNEFHDPIRLFTKRPDSFPLKRDEEGYTKLQLWQVMRIFGPHMDGGFHTPLETGFIFKNDLPHAE